MTTVPQSRAIVVTGASKGVGLARQAAADFPGEFLTVDLADPVATAAMAAALASRGASLGRVA